MVRFERNPSATPAKYRALYAKRVLFQIAADMTGGSLSGLTIERLKIMSKIEGTFYILSIIDYFTIKLLHTAIYFQGIKVSNDVVRY